MGQCRGLGIPIEDLRDASLRRHRLLLVSPVASGEGVLETIRDGVVFDRKGDVELLVRLDTLRNDLLSFDFNRTSAATNLLKVTVHVLGELAEQHAEQVREKGTREVKALFTEVVTVIEVSAFQSSEQETMDHVAKEVRLLGLGTLGHGDVRQHLLLKNFLSVS